tara:strand:+ start:714 stop:1124 length:411 start_codon:yes stop_codon:yes gene_type:complete
MDYLILKEKYKHIADVKENNQYGNLCFYLQNLDLKLIKNKHQEFINYIYLCCLNCLKISSKYKNTTYTVHIYLENVTMKQFSLSLFKKMNKQLEEKLQEDVLNTCYVYNATNITKKLFYIISPFLNQDTKNKIVLC